jgi:hypothetical protein
MISIVFQEKPKYVCFINFVLWADLLGFHFGPVHPAERLSCRHFASGLVEFLQWGKLRLHSEVWNSSHSSHKRCLVRKIYILVVFDGVRVVLGYAHGL